jgi:hypothetical protein
MPVTKYESLRLVVNNLATVDDSFTLYAPRPWSANSPIWAARLDEVTRRPEGYECLLEVDLVREVLEVWSAWRNGQIPTTNEACTAVIYYAEHDAYQPAADSDGEQ